MTHAEEGVGPGVGEPCESLKRRSVEEALRRGRPRHLGLLLRRLPTHADAEDVLQDVTARALSRADTLTCPDKVDTWLNALLRNAVVDRYRREAARRRREVVAGDWDGTLERGSDWEEVGECLLRLLIEVKPAYQTVLRRAELEGASLKQVAAELGVTPNNVAVRLHRARRALRARLVDRCQTCAVADRADCPAPRALAAR